MSIFRSNVVVDPLDQAVSKGRSVRGMISGFVADLDESNALHNEVIAAEEAKIREAQGRKEIATQEISLNTTLASNLRTALGQNDQ